MEGERRGKDRLLNNLDPLWQASSKLDDVCAAESGRSNEISKGETVEH